MYEVSMNYQGKVMYDAIVAIVDKWGVRHENLALRLYEVEIPDYCLKVHKLIDGWTARIVKTDAGLNISVHHADRDVYEVSGCIDNGSIWLEEVLSYLQSESFVGEKLRFIQELERIKECVV
jgi:hypothetical protein